MSFKIPELPFETDRLEPYISKKTVDVHYGKHHKGYVKKLNELTKNTAYEKMPIENVIVQSREKREKEIFNQAAQVWNHSFYWECLAPNKRRAPSNALSNVLKKSFQSVDGFKESFSESAVRLFGSGWVWLVKNGSDTLSIKTTKDADNFLGTSYTPLLACDVWEHAYYLDYQNSREDYMQVIWKILNWEFVERNL